MPSLSDPLYVHEDIPKFALYITLHIHCTCTLLWPHVGCCLELHFLLLLFGLSATLVLFFHKTLNYF